MKAMTPNKEKPCYLYIQQNEQNIPNSQELQRQLETGKMEDKIKALKSLIISIIHDEAYPRMLMTIFNYLVPIQNESHNLKKVLLYYWEIIEKVNANGTLKDEMILVCNSIRNDLLHPNEYIRGRTLRLLSRVMYRGILEPLAPSILENLTYKHTYVRRNAVSCLYVIYLNFKDELITDVDEHIEKLLLIETDLSTRRNAFLLLFNCNQQKALEFINERIINEQTEEMGDIMQLVVLELLRKTCKVDPSQKSKLMKAVFFFSNSKSSSVLFECSNTLIQISNSSTYLKLAVNIYIQLLNSNSDNNVKLIVLDKLAYIRNLNSKLIEEMIVEITNALNNQSFAIRRKTVDLIKNIITPRNSQIILTTMFKELNKVAHSSEDSEVEYRNLLLNNFTDFVVSFPNICTELLNVIFDQLINFAKMDENSSNAIVLIMKLIVTNHEDLQTSLVKNLHNKLNEINSFPLLKVSLWILGEFSNENTIEESIICIKKAIGSLPLEEEKNQAQNVEEESKDGKKGKIDASTTTATAPVKKIRVKTIILPDGTYGTEVINENDTKTNIKNENVETHSPLRENLIKSSLLMSVLSTALLKLVYSLKEDILKFNRYGSDVILILCSLLRLLKGNSQNKENNELIERIMGGIKLITNPELFLNHHIGWLEKKHEKILHHVAHPDDKRDNEEDIHIAKQPDDLIILRQLKGRSTMNEFDLADEEINELPLQTVDEEEDYTTKLSKIIQLTGYSDPIYAEAFMKIHKYDIFFEILLVNRINKPLQNVSVEFSTQGDLRVLEKPQQVILGPLQSVQLKTSIKLSSSEAGIIFASINFENSAGMTQSYMITNEIMVDLVDFIYPADIEDEDFRKCWSKYEWENRLTINSKYEEPLDYIKLIANGLKMKILTDVSKIETAKFISVNLYAKTKLDDDFLINISIENSNNKMSGYLRIRSKTKGIVINLGDRIKKLQRN